ncbi:hypothetical protein PPYR_14493 [Photinus pyralis]|uniref:RRM domain-containing protein n=1 Tax=Photinus pyralis TaxID=7054 RepID=A0A5N4A5B8_PHOPY|nr:probable RNA-binding protein 46 isoform X2 [Photinus pyralis]KAB0792534.1 hypothetical protein PPYR_14493 [Photinus pyralis]
MLPFPYLRRSKATPNLRRYHSALFNFMANNNLETVEYNGERVTTPRNRPTFVTDRDCEVFFREIPRNIFEDELIPLFARVGAITKFRLMLDVSGFNLGYGFVTYADARSADGAVAMIHDYEIRCNRHIVVYKSIDNCRLVMDAVPADKTNLEVYGLLKERVDGIARIISYPARICGITNRSSILIEFVNHAAAALALRRLGSRFTLWDKVVYVDWLHPIPEVPWQIMSQVKKLYIRNLPLYYNEANIRASVCNIINGSLITKIHWISNNFACIHFTSNQSAELAMNWLNSTAILGEGVEISLGSPPKYLIYQRMDAPELTISTAPRHAMNPTNAFGLPVHLMRRIVQQGRLAVSREVAYRPAGL